MDNVQNNQQQIEANSGEMIQFKDLYYLCLAKWYWFIISILACLSIAIYYLLSTPSVYTRSAELLINDNSKGNSAFSADMGGFENLGLFKSNMNVKNELIALRSPASMYEVVKRLRLDMSYMTEGRFHDQVAYGKDLPVEVSLLEANDETSVGFTLNVNTKGEVQLSEFKDKGKDIDEKKTVKGKINETIETPVGKLIVTPTQFYQKDEAVTLKVNRSPLYAVSSAYSAKLSASLGEKDASVIAMSFQDVCPQRAEDVLNTLITVYNENWVKDKNKIAVSTSMFINERLKVIEQELGSVDENISSYKSKNLLPDIQAASQLYMNQSSETNAQLLTLNNQLYMARYVRSYLTDGAHKHQLLPANSGIGAQNIETQIASYNDKLLQRNSLVASSSEKNPLVVDLDQALVSMEKAIITSIDNQLQTLQTQIKSLKDLEVETTSRIAASPTQAKDLLSVERQQKVKEALYIFLLQKREENELSQAFTAYNTRIITPPSGSKLPTAPKKQMILLVALVLGAAIPVGIVFLREMMNTKLRGRKDLENIKAPFIGEVPLYLVGANRRKHFIPGKTIEKSNKSLVVQEGNRDIINEAFRVLRTNLEFMVGKEEQGIVLTVTSFNPGSGKTFISMNMAVSLAIKGKKVLVVDGDMRHASASQYVKSPKKGLSNYLSGNEDDVESLFIRGSIHTNMDVLSVGSIPPNPTELLYNDRFATFVANMKKKYDYVIIDCPPIEIVADTQIISKYSDRTVFVLRAGLLERTMIPELDRLYTEKKYKNLSIVLNGTETASGGHYAYQYGYKYGYKYGYHAYGGYYGSK